MNSATVTTVWTMSRVKTFLSNMLGKSAYPFLHFCSEYWWLPLYDDLQSYKAFMTADGVLQLRFIISVGQLYDKVSEVCSDVTNNFKET